MVETLLGQAITLLVWALFGGQPMILMGLTGPIAIYVEVLYQLATYFEYSISFITIVHLIYLSLCYMNGLVFGLLFFLC